MTVNWLEQVLPFRCQDSALVAILTQPEAVSPRLPRNDLGFEVGVLIVVGGPQYRAGSHRQFVLLARDLAAAGWPTLRFDVRGMGDSAGVQRNFEQLSEDIGAAISAMQMQFPNMSRIVLHGLCDGASAALIYLHETGDQRVAALSLTNPWVRSEAGLARAQVKHYYLQRLLQRDFWRKLAVGGVGWPALKELRASLQKMAVGRSLASADITAQQVDFRQAMALGIRSFGGPIFIATSGRDLTAQEFLDHAERDVSWQAVLASKRCRQVRFEQADHTFSDLHQQASLHTSIIAWLTDASGMIATPRRNL